MEDQAESRGIPERANARSADETEVRQLIDQRVAAIREKDIDPLRALLAPNVVLSDALPPLRRFAAEDDRAKTAEWLGADDALNYEVRDLDVAARGDVAFCHYLGRVVGTMTGGRRGNMWLRWTVGLRKLDGTWTIVHEHRSVPFHAETGMGAVGLAP